MVSGGKVPNSYDCVHTTPENFCFFQRYYGLSLLCVGLELHYGHCGPGKWLKSLEEFKMWHLGTWLRGGLSSARVGLNDFKDLFQPK